VSGTVHVGPAASGFSEARLACVDKVIRRTPPMIVNQNQIAT